MAPWTSGTVFANGIRIHYHRTGGAKPSLVMAHGHSDNGLCWARVARALEHDLDLIMYDARAHGQSEDGPRTISADTRAQDAVAFNHALALDRPGMIGHSMGASTAALAASLYPDKISYIILEDPAWFDEETRRRWGHNPSADRSSQPTTLEGWRAQVEKRDPAWHDDEKAAWAQAHLEFARHREPDRPERRPWQETAAKIVCPTLLVTGDPEQGSIVTPSVAEAALSLMPRIEVAHVKGAGHCIHRDRFEPYIKAVASFIGCRQTE